MKSENTSISLAAILTVALLSSGCSNITPEQWGGVGDTVGVIADNLTQQYTGQRPFEELFRNVAYSTSKASAEQREVALGRARRYYARLDADQKQALRKKGVRYLAVNTTRDGNSNKGQPVMTFDTETLNMTTDDSVYTLKNKTKQGTPIKLDTHASEYIANAGAGDI
jgi:hypothetical protein